MISKKIIDKAEARTEWNVGNSILYDMCKKYPSHSSKGDVLAKIWLIGRAYAAAIERRKKFKELIGDEFYSRVWEIISKEPIDDWLKNLKGIDAVSTETLGTILFVHKKLTDCFETITGLKKRSLASKYLHFHYPDLFFIYDARAVKAASKLSSGIVKNNGDDKADHEYKRFCKKCLKICDDVKQKYGVTLSPRRLDDLLLLIEETS